MKGKLIFILVLFVICAFDIASAQQVTISGKVTDAETGEPLPYVLISLVGTSFGSESNEEGMYSFVAKVKKGDSVSVSYIGYDKARKAVFPSPENQVLNFAMKPDGNMMQEIVVTIYENPAFPIMRKVMKQKDTNDPRKINAFRYDNYSKMELSIDNLGPKMQKKKFMRAVEKELLKDSLTLEKGKDGKPVLPVMFSETISKVYRNREGLKSKEEILAVKNNNIGLANGKLIKPMLYSTYQESNFYLNRITILQTDFQSPIADGWQLLYAYELIDTVLVDGDSCFRINVEPKNPRDLAFTGTIWIENKTYAVKQLELSTNNKTKLNFVESIKISQLNRKTSETAWMPYKTRIELDLSGITHWKLGILARLTTYAENIVVNDPMPGKFFDEGVVEMEDAFDRAREMDTLRRDTLTTYETDFGNSIQTIRNVKPIKRYVALANVASSGYVKWGKIEFGHLMALYNNNNIEGLRLSLGFRTNPKFSRKIIFKGSLAYGFLDEEFKYNGGVEWILNRRPWTVMGIEHRYDMDQVGVNAEQVSNNQIFYAFSKNGTMRGPYYNTTNAYYFQTDIKKGITQRFTFRNRDFNPAYAFTYYASADSALSTNFTTSELIFDTRWGKDEFRFIDGNYRYSLGAKKWPIVNFRNVIGVKDLFNSDFSYYKFNVMLSHNFALGILGRTYYDISAGKIIGNVPYPILETHIGNQSYFYSTVAFNQMNFFEFISDTYSTLRLRHYFGGLFFNRIPLIKKFKWGFFTTSNVAIGSMSKKNLDLIPQYNLSGRDLRIFNTLNTKPYVEVGYGIDNIFKVLRVDFVHRISYLNLPDVRKFGIKVSFQISL